MPGNFERGDRVRISDGLFRNFTGMVEDVDAQHRTLSVLVMLLSRKLSIELRFTDAQKI